MANSITVIIPTYNAERWLNDSLMSLQSQSFRYFNAIIADDGSTDNTAEIATSFSESDSRFKLLQLSHGGVSAARNAGIETADTEWIIFLDADDMLHPSALQLLYETAQNTEADIVIPRITYGDKPTELSESDIRKEAEITDNVNLLRRLLLRQGVEASICGSLYRRSLFNDPTPLRLRNCRYEDLDISYQIPERAKRIAILPQPLYFYRRHNDSFIRSFSPQRLDALDVTDRMYQHFRGTSLEYAAADRRFSAHFNILLVMLSYGAGDDAARRRCFDVIRSQRRKTLTTKGVRMRNRLGALLSYGGMPLLRLIAKICPQR